MSTLSQELASLTAYKANRSAKPIRTMVSDTFETACVATNTVKLALKMAESELEKSYLESRLEYALWVKEQLAKLGE